MSDLPEPLTPADCDLTDFKFMPLEVVRLRKSKAWLFAKREPEIGFYAINLWAMSWHEVPAASLEDDDDALADYAMCNPERWPEVREKVLRGWVKCSDGRLYHATVAEKAKESWERKQEQRHKTEAARQALKAKRQAMSSGVTKTVTEIAGATTDIATASKGQGQGQGQGEESKQAAEPALLKLPASPFPEMPAIEYEAKTGRATVAGYYLDRTQERVFEAARIDDTKWMGNIKPLIEWLAAGIEPDTIVGAISRRVEQGKYAVPHSLNYFDKPVREAHGRAGP
jgi:hypothetical protein